MLNDSQRMMVQTKGVVIGRMLMGLLFLSAGVGMLMAEGGPAASVGFYESVGLPMAGLMVWLVVAIKIVAGGLLILGKHVGNAACALIVFTALATLLAHRDLADMNLFKNLAIIGGLLYVMAFGAGRWSSN